MAELLLKMRHPEGVAGSWRGQTFEPDAEGDIAVPFEAAEDLKNHGFAPSGQIGGEDRPRPRLSRRRAARASKPCSAT